MIIFLRNFIRVSNYRIYRGRLFFTTDQVKNLSLVKLDATVKLPNHTY